TRLQADHAAQPDRHEFLQRDRDAQLFVGFARDAAQALPRAIVPADGGVEATRPGILVGGAPLKEQPAVAGEDPDMGAAMPVARAMHELAHLGAAQRLATLIV